MPVIKEYMIVCKDAVSDLEGYLEMYIKQGWQPFGGVSGAVCRIRQDLHGRGQLYNYIFTQALVKYEESNGKESSP